MTGIQSPSAPRVPQLPQIKTGDPTLDRLLQQWIAVLNPVLKNLPPLIGSQPVVSGSTGGNAALQSLITALAQIGLIVDRTTP